MKNIYLTLIFSVLYLLVPEHSFGKTPEVLNAATQIVEAVDAIDNLLFQMDQLVFLEDVEIAVLYDRFYLRAFQLSDEIELARINALSLGRIHGRISLEGARHEWKAFIENFGRLMTFVENRPDINEDVQIARQFYLVAHKELLQVFETDPSQALTSLFQTATAGTHQATLLRGELEAFEEEAHNVAIQFPEFTVLVRRLNTRIVELREEVYQYVYFPLIEENAVLAKVNFPNSRHELEGLAENYKKLVVRLPMVAAGKLSSKYEEVLKAYENLENMLRDPIIKK